MVWAFDDVNDLILDVFGFLFMQSLDDYSGIIDYGIEQTDFARIIQERSIEVDTKVRWDPENGRDVRQAEFDSVMPKAHWLKTRIVQGDVFYTVGRIVNFLALCFGCPTFLALKWVDDREHTSDLLSEIMDCQSLPVGLLLMGACFCVSFIWYMWHQPRKQRSYQSFFYQVILLRPDPIEVRQIQEDVLSRSFVRKQHTYTSIASSEDD